MDKMRVFIKYLMAFSITVFAFTLFVFNLFNIDKIEKPVIYVGGTHIHTSDNTPEKFPKENESAFVPSQEPQNFKALSLDLNIQEKSASFDFISSYDETPNLVSDNEPLIITVSSQTLSEDLTGTPAVEAISIDSHPQGNIYRAELMYQFILKYSGLLPQRKQNESEIFISPDKPVITESQDKTVNSESHDIPVISLPPEKNVKVSEDIPVITQALSKDNSQEKLIPDNSESLPEIFTGWLKNRNDKNHFTFELKHSSAVKIGFTSSEEDRAYYRLTVKGASNSVITRKMIDSENHYTDTGNIYLKAGNYTIEIEAGYSWSGKPYKLIVNTSKALITEAEGNNTPQTATVIPLNEDVRASSGTRNDIDYFIFTLEKPSSVRPYLNFHKVRGSKGVYTFKLYAVNFLEIDKRPFIFRGDGTPSRKISPFILDAGTYIISVSRLENEDLELGLHEYTLRVDAEELM
ncbi:MAG: hypothetical protein IJU07_03300 [Synergistaceae bacterium]|nr:hypothetical protein [Synergistaceae bacterium]